MEEEGHNIDLSLWLECGWQRATRPNWWTHLVRSLSTLLWAAGISDGDLVR